jgi:hypothetical protein
LETETFGGTDVLRTASERQWVYVSQPLDDEIRRRVSREAARAKPWHVTPSVASFTRRAIRAYLARRRVPTGWRPENEVTPGGRGFEGEAQTRRKLYLRVDRALKTEILRRVEYEREVWGAKTRAAREAETPDERELRLRHHGARARTWPDPPTVSSFVRRALREWLRRNPA